MGKHAVQDKIPRAIDRQRGLIYRMLLTHLCNTIDLVLDTSYLRASTMKSQLSPHKFRVQKSSNMVATVPPSWMYSRIPSRCGYDDVPDNEKPSVGTVLDFIRNPNQPSYIATVNRSLK